MVESITDLGHVSYRSEEGGEERRVGSNEQRTTITPKSAMQSFHEIEGDV
jgi:hypothetical protein